MGLEERICALQSLLGIAQHLRSMRKQMQAQLSTSQAAHLDTYFARTVEASGKIIKKANSRAVALLCRLSCYTGRGL